MKAYLALLGGSVLFAYCVSPPPSERFWAFVVSMAIFGIPLILSFYDSVKRSDDA